jgi:hypothetical protein
MIFASFSKAIILSIQQTLINTVLQNTVPRERENDDAESRKYAVRSLITIYLNLGLKSVGTKNIKTAIDCLFKAINDYAIDKRGDVGSWVREEAMRGLNILINEIFYNSDKDLLAEVIPEDPSQFILHYIQTILQQLMEKIDRIRQVAGEVLQSFLVKFEKDLPEFEEKDTLMSIFGPSLYS